MSWPAVIAPKRAVLLCALVGAILAAVVLALRWRSITEYIVTSAAIADARDVLAKRRPYGESFVDDAEAVTNALARGWSPWFRAGYLDRGLLLGRMASGKDATEAACVIDAYYEALGREDEQFVIEEIVGWCEFVALSSSAKGLLIDILMGDLSLIPRCPNDPPVESTRLGFFTMLFSPSPDDPLFRGLHHGVPHLIVKAQEQKQRVLGAIANEAWQGIVRDTRAVREKTRAGALLLLYRHPEISVFEREARRALGDGSQLVRLAAAGVLAMKGIDAGEGFLLDGMGHERWEIRFWCLHGIVALGKHTPHLIERRLKEEKDPWLLALLQEVKP